MVEGLQKSSSVTEPGPLDSAGIPEGCYLGELVVTGPVGWRWGRGDRHEAHRSSLVRPQPGLSSAPLLPCDRG